MRIQSFLFLMLILLPRLGEAAMIKHFSIMGDRVGAILLAPGDVEVGVVEDRIGSSIRKIEYKQKSYFMKDAEINDDTKLLGFKDKISGLVASYILNELFRGEERRYPLLRLVFNSRFRMEKSKNSEKDIEPFYIIYKELRNFERIANFIKGKSYHEYKIGIIDLENLYIGMYLVGGGDPNVHNLFYNSGNSRLGNIDLEGAFKEHVTNETQLQHNPMISPEFSEQYSDLAVRNINCNDIFANFLSATDFRFRGKMGWDSYYDSTIPLYSVTRKMNRMRMTRAIHRLQWIFPDRQDLHRVINTTISILQEELRPIINSLLVSGETIFNAQGYFDKNGPVYKKYREARLIKALDFLFDEEQAYRSQVNQFVEQRYLTLICVFGASETVTQEQCEECLKSCQPPSSATITPPQPGSDEL